MAMIVTRSKPIEFRVIVDMGPEAAITYIRGWSFCLVQMLERLSESADQSFSVDEDRHGVGSERNDARVAINCTKLHAPIATEVANFVLRPSGRGHQTLIMVSCRSAYTPQLLSGFFELIHDLPLATQLGRLVDIGVRSAHIHASANGTQNTQRGEKPRKQPRKRRIHAGTLRSLDALIDLRQKLLEDDAALITFTTACQRVGIEPQTVKRHCPWLRSVWYRASVTTDEIRRRIGEIGAANGANGK